MEINDLPVVILSLILSFTGLDQFGKVMYICKKWFKACQSKPYLTALLWEYCEPRLVVYNIKRENYELIPDFMKDCSWNQIFALKKQATSLSEIGTVFFEKNGFYEGYLSNLVLEGSGCLYRKDTGLAYRGTLRGGKPNGDGFRIWPSGDKFIGTFIESKRSGYGVIYFKDGGIYKGNFKNDLRSGYGVIKFGNGDKYKGTWEADYMSGHGKFISKSNFIYNGGWSKNLRSGYGILTYTLGSYSGYFYEGKAEKYGIINFKNGALYVGEMHLNYWHGLGTYIWANNDIIYSGYFSTGNRHGYGELYAPGYKYIGNFKNDKAHGISTEIFENGIKFVGNFKKGFRSGFGTIYKSDGIKFYEGAFMNGIINGEGSFYINGTYVRGIFKGNDIIDIIDNPGNIAINAIKLDIIPNNVVLNLIINDRRF